MTTTAPMRRPVSVSNVSAPRRSALFSKNSRSAWGHMPSDDHSLSMNAGTAPQ
ncbi:MAG: hypothetical protein VW547_00150 [Alphaproteobacteria bacterium]